MNEWEENQNKQAELYRQLAELQKKGSVPMQEYNVRRCPQCGEKIHIAIESRVLHNRVDSMRERAPNEQKKDNMD